MLNVFFLNSAPPLLVYGGRNFFLSFRITLNSVLVYQGRKRGVCETKNMVYASLGNDRQAAMLN